MPTLQQRIVRLRGVKRRIAKAEEAVRELKKEYDVQETELLSAMDAEGLSDAGSRTSRSGRVRIASTTHVGVEDAEKLGQYVLRHRSPHLFHNRVSKTAVFEITGPAPALADFDTKKQWLQAVVKWKTKVKGLGLCTYTERKIRFL